MALQLPHNTGLFGSPNPLRDPGLFPWVETHAKTIPGSDRRHVWKTSRQGLPSSSHVWKKSPVALLPLATASTVVHSHATTFASLAHDLLRRALPPLVLLLLQHASSGESTEQKKRASCSWAAVHGGRAAGVGGETGRRRPNGTEEEFIIFNPLGHESRVTFPHPILLFFQVIRVFSSAGNGTDTGQVDYNVVPFSYGSSAGSDGPNNSSSYFLPSFPVPESLLNKLLIQQ